MRANSEDAASVDQALVGVLVATPTTATGFRCPQANDLLGELETADAEPQGNVTLRATPSGAPPS